MVEQQRESQKNDSLPTDSICIVGAGAIGRSFAGILAPALPVFMVQRKELSTGIKNTTLELCGDINKTIHPDHFSIVTNSDLDRLPQRTTFFICVKAHQLQGAIKVILPFVTPSTPVVLCCNGLSVMLEAASLLPGDTPLLRMLCYFGARLDSTSGNSKIIISGKPKISITGLKEYQPHVVSWTNYFNSLPDCTAFTEKDVATAEWNKAATNIIVNSLATLAQEPNGIVCQSDPLTSLADELFAEIQLIAAAEGFHLPDELLSQIMQGIEHFSENTNSTLLDIKAGRKTEIDALHGRALRIAKAYQVPAPRLHTLYLLLKALEDISMAARL